MNSQAWLVDWQTALRRLANVSDVPSPLRIRGLMIVRFIKLLGSLAFFAFDQLAGRAVRCLRRSSAAPCVVLYYHGVDEGQRPAFARQMDALLRWATPVRADVAPPLRRNLRHAAVTFDDGLVSVWENALPELADRGIPATIFVPTAWLGKPPGWGNYRAATNLNERVISREELLAHKAINNVLIGSHSATHTRLSRLTDSRLLEELAESKRVLEEILHYEITLFSFPHGDLDNRTIDHARKIGYKRVFSIVPAYALTCDNEYVTPRVDVSPDDWPVEFWLKLMGAYRWLPLAFTVKRVIYATFRVNYRSDDLPPSKVLVK
jgi:peptidoglycan/xylan/chitin deacetylase (PgdA/CDA1 family)